jgi:medium-chain acyl-[acyl-carrier-protein] hydrolase
LLFRQQPRMGDQVTIETWGKGVQRVYLLRDFAVIDESGVRMVSASAVWLLVDQRRGLPHRWSSQSEFWPWLPERHELETSVEKVPELQAGEQVGIYRVHFSDIDVNRHVNATRYLQWIVDSHSQEHLEASELASVDLSFIAEALPGDEVVVFSEPRDGSELCAVRRAGDGKDLCRAALTWRCLV